jgi:hypothetical protein
MIRSIRIFFEKLLLWVRIRGRIDDLKQGRVSPEQYMVPGARALLESLKERGLKLYLASGTDEIYMREEARLLDVVRYFDGGVYGRSRYIFLYSSGSRGWPPRFRTRPAKSIIW